MHAGYKKYWGCLAEGEGESKDIHQRDFRYSGGVKITKNQGIVEVGIGKGGEWREENGVRN